MLLAFRNPASHHRNHCWVSAAANFYFVGKFPGQCCKFVSPRPDQDWDVLSVNRITELDTCTQTEHLTVISGISSCKQPPDNFNCLADTHERRSLLPNPPSFHTPPPS